MIPKKDLSPVLTLQPARKKRRPAGKESRERTWYAGRRRRHPNAPFHHTAAKISSLTAAFSAQA